MRTRRWSRRSSSPPNSDCALDCELHRSASICCLAGPRPVAIRVRVSAPLPNVTPSLHLHRASVYSGGCVEVSVAADHLATILRRDNSMKKMIKQNHRKQRLLMLLLLLQLCALMALGQTSVSIRMNVDACDASRNVLHTTLTIPVKPGPLSLFYPKWIPGEHSPTGPINDMVGLRLTANGKSIPWTRDAVEMFAFSCEIPAGASELEVAFDDVSQPGTTMSARLARVKWNRVLVYPRGMNSDAIHIDTSIKLLGGWKFAIALTVLRERRDEVEFKEVTLTE